MALSERHRWCISKILESFGEELKSEAVNTFMRQEAVASKFTQFFAGESSGRLFVFYQPEITDDGVSNRPTSCASERCFPPLVCFMDYVAAVMLLVCIGELL